MNTSILLLTGAIAAMATFFVSVRLQQGPVRSSAGLSLLVGLGCYFSASALPPFLADNLPVVFIGASFIGMVSSNVTSSYTLIGLSGLVFSLLYLNTSSFFTGYGGGLGTAACISLLTVIGLPFVTKKHRLSNGYLVLRKLIFRKK